MYTSAVIFLLVVCSSRAYRSAFDLDLYESVLDEESCTRQLEIIATDPLGLVFVDVSGKVPTSVLTGNLNHLGDYFQCLAISETVNGTLIEGKYSGILIPIPSEIPEFSTLPPDFTFPTLPPDFTLPTLPPDFTLPTLPPLSPTTETTDGNSEAPDISIPESESENGSIRIKRQISDNIRQKQEESYKVQAMVRMMAGVSHVMQPISEEQKVNTRVFPVVITASRGALLGICIPKPCTATQALDFFQEQVPLINFTFNEFYYRLPNDKPFVPADYVAFVIMSIITCLVIASTAYNLYCTFVLKVASDKLLSCFSIYTNTRRLLTFNSYPGTLECVDGIRAISMLWVIVGHTYSLTLLGYVQNIVEALGWLRLFTSTWVNSAPLTVDTFFLLSGILSVYTTIGKISKARFIRTIHLFYMNRLLRMFPLLAIVILFQASIFNHVSDGPFWINVAEATENCRLYWWSALLHVQNYVNPLNVCVIQTWYLSVDTQLYLVCPIILVWMFGSKRVAWAALSVFLVLSLISASVYSFLYGFSAALVQPSRITEFADYLQVYYFNTLTRAPPFFVGMCYGYALHLYRNKKVVMSKPIVGAVWVLCVILLSFCFFSIFPVMQLEWDGQAFDNFLNAYMRSFWAVAVGWIIFACHHGYGGPVNWFLSLTMWKLPARLSFAMYLIHVSIMMIANGSWTDIHYFTNGDNIYRYMSDVTLTLIAAFVLCVTVDAPFSTLQKILNGSGKKKPPQKPKQSIENGIVERTTL